MNGSAKRRLLIAISVAWLTGCGGSAAPSPSDAPPTARPTVPDVAPERARALGLTRRLPLSYRRACAKQAAYAPADARVCPPLVPDGAAKVMDAIPFSREAGWGGGFVADFGSRSLDRIGNRAVETNGGHWHYDVTWTARVRTSVVRSIERPQAADRPSHCLRSTLGGQHVETCHVVPHEHGGGLHGGHVAYLWRHGRVLYVVSVHGYPNAPRGRCMMQALIARVLR